MMGMFPRQPRDVLLFQPPKKATFQGTSKKMGQIYTLASLTAAIPIRSRKNRENFRCDKTYVKVLQQRREEEGGEFGNLISTICSLGRSPDVFWGGGVGGHMECMANAPQPYC